MRFTQTAVTCLRITLNHDLTNYRFYTNNALYSDGDFARFEEHIDEAEDFLKDIEKIPIRDLPASFVTYHLKVSEQADLIQSLYDDGTIDIQDLERGLEAVYSLSKYRDNIISDILDVDKEYITL